MDNPHAAAVRKELEEFLDSIEFVADQRHDHVLLLTLTALRRVHDLYPEADALRMRGTPEQRARFDIHNAIAEVVNDYLRATGAAPAAQV